MALQYIFTHYTIIFLSPIFISMFYFTKKIALVCLLTAFWASAVQAQMLTDGVFMPQNTMCTGFSFEQSQFSNYWEGTLKRDNPNVGTMTVQSIAYMLNYGITSKLNVIVALPYVATQATGGTLRPMSGIQDLTVGLKYQAFEWHLGKDQFSGVAEIGGTLPVTNYVAAFPLAIGTQSKSVFGRALLRYITKNDFIAEGSAAYWWRSNVTIDQTNYYTNNSYVTTNQVVMPDVAQLALKLGYYTYRWGIVASGQMTNCTSGSDIRRGDMFFPNNNIDATRVGIEGHYRIEALNDLYLTASVLKTIDGRNAGEATSLMFSAAYVFDFNKKEAIAQ